MFGSPINHTITLMRPPTTYRDFDYTNILGYFLKQFMTNAYESITGDNPVFVIEMDLKESQLGNRLGNYFQAVCLAEKLGLHFIAFNHYKRQVGDDFMKVGHPFLKDFPRVIRHGSPAANRSAVVEYLKSGGGMHYLEPWPWQRSDSCWYQNVQFAQHTMRSSLENVQSKLFLNTNSPEIHAASFEIVDGVNTADNNSLFVAAKKPLVPDAVILLRCVDVLLHGGNEYGFLSFNTYPMIIPKDVKDIYIVGEPYGYGPWVTACHNISNALVAFLHNLYPQTKISLRRGFPFESMIMMMKASYVVCAPSSFCFWSALANEHGNVYYANSPLIVEAKRPRLTDNFNWITYPPVIGFWRQVHYKLEDTNSSEYIIATLTARTLPKEREITEFR